jgi:hypothetical protein
VKETTVERAGKESACCKKTRLNGAARTFLGFVVSRKDVFSLTFQNGKISRRRSGKPAGAKWEK